MTTPANSLLFPLLSARSAWLGQRQAVLARNLANSDTPGYKPMDLEPFTRALHAFGRKSVAPPLRLTEPSHQTGAAAQRQGVAGSRQASSFETAPSGNAVVLEEQMQKLASTQLEHQLATSIYSRHVAMLRTAIGAPQG